MTHMLATQPENTPYAPVDIHKAFENVYGKDQLPLSRLAEKYSPFRKLGAPERFAAKFVGCSDNPDDQNLQVAPPPLRVSLNSSAQKILLNYGSVTMTDKPLLHQIELGYSDPQKLQRELGIREENIDTLLSRLPRVRPVTLEYPQYLPITRSDCYFAFELGEFTLQSKSYKITLPGYLSGVISEERDKKVILFSNTADKVQNGRVLFSSSASVVKVMVYENTVSLGEVVLGGASPITYRKTDLAYRRLESFNQTKARHLGGPK